MKLLLGTSNQAKINHYKTFLRGSQIEILTLNDIGIQDAPAETGKTLKENAILKAKFYYKKSQIPTIADDSGFEIPALDNWPGVQSRRLDGAEASDKEIIKTVIYRMSNLKGNKRKAYMKVVLALALSEKNIVTAEGRIEGFVPETPYKKLESRFPYRSLLFISSINKWFYDIDEQQENQIGFRRTALEKLKPYLYGTGTTYNRRGDSD